MVAVDPMEVPIAYECPPGKIDVEMVYGVANPPAKITSDQVAPLVDEWISSFNHFLGSDVKDKELIEAMAGALFRPNGIWNDQLALEWDYRTIMGLPDIAQYLQKNLKSSGMRGLEVDTANGFTPVVFSPDENIEWIQVPLKFQVNGAQGDGIALLIRDPSNQDKVACLLLYTTIDSINGFEPKINRSRVVHHRGFTPGRKYEHENSHSEEPLVLVVGGGHSGLCVAAHLKVRGVDCLVVEKEKRVGDVWRNRYDLLRIWIPAVMAQLPFMNYPDSFPEFIPKETFAGWLETYVKSLDLNVWTESTVDKLAYDEATRRWTVTVTKAGTPNTVIHPAHVVMASGVLGRGVTPNFTDMDKFKGEIVDYTTYRNGRKFKGQNVAVIGTGLTGHDVAQDLYEQGATGVTMVQRVSYFGDMIERYN
jgi:hypothetical protein